MSAPLNLSIGDLKNIAAALNVMTTATRNNAVEFGAYGQASITVDNADKTVLGIDWDVDACEYVIADRVGS